MKRCTLLRILSKHGKPSLFCPHCYYALQNDCYFFKCTFIPLSSRRDWALCLEKPTPERLPLKQG